MRTYSLFKAAAVIAFSTLLSAASVWAGEHSAVPGMAEPSCLKEGFLPPNSLKIEANAIRPLSNGMTEAKFNALLDRVENIYKPIVAQQGAQLSFLRYWSDGTINAYADRTGNQWYVKMFGGLARHDAITEDGFTLVACHEVGHHLGGAPKYSGQWAANEGQSDYFATLKCLRKVWESDNNVEIVKQLIVDSSVTQSCEKSFGDAAQIALCVRGAVAGLSSANLMRALAGSGPIDFKTPDPSVVAMTYDKHPAAQCRLDTYYGGAICQVGVSEPLSNTDPTVGTCSSEKSYTVGVRPLCWYKPGGTSPGPGPGPGPGPVPTPDGVAKQPLLNGQAQLTLGDPRVTFPVDYDVSEFAGAGGVYIEVSQVNRELAGPNGTQPDPQRLGGATKAGVRGRFTVTPIQGLPQGWGVYSFRVIPLDASGTRPVGRFSNSSKLTMRQGGRAVPALGTRLGAR